jgi:capsular exopolysaccharide synthesis family protein
MAGSPRGQDSLLEILWRQRKLVLRAALIGLAISLLYLVFASRQYTSASRLMVSRGRASLLDNSHAPPASDDDNFLSTQREIVSSNPVLALALGSPAMQGLRTFEGRTSKFDTLKKQLGVEVGKKVDLLSVSFEGKYPQENTVIVNAVVQAYIEFETDQRQAASRAAIVALNAEKQQTEKDLAQKNKELIAFRAANNLMDVGASASQSNEAQTHALNTALTQADLDVVAARTQYSQALQQLQANPQLKKQLEESTTADPADASPEDLALLKQELSLARARAREMQRQYLPGHPAVKLAGERVDQLTLQLVRALKAQLGLAQAKEIELQDLLDAEKLAAIRQSAALVEFDRLSTNITHLQQMADSVDRRARELGLSGDDSDVTINVLETAHADEHPTKPQKSVALVMGLLAGLFAGAVTAAVRDRYDRRMSTPQDVQSLLGLEVLATLPAISAEIVPVDRALQAHLAPDSETAEAFRTLCTSLLYAGNGKPSKILLVASPNAGDGRSTVASNLAISFAESGARVLLVDADLRSPMQDWIFSATTAGVRDFAPGIDSENDLAGLCQITHSGVKRLDVLTTSSSIKDPIRFLNDRSFAEHLEKQADEYDQIIVDSPSLHSVPDARMLAAHCDASLLVLRQGGSNRLDAEKALQSLQRVGAAVIGVVFNNIPVETGQEAGKFPMKTDALLTQQRRRASATAPGNLAMPVGARLARDKSVPLRA